MAKFEGVVESKGTRAARVLMDLDWERAGYDRWTRMAGTLAKNKCSAETWKQLRNGSRLRLRLGACDFANVILSFVPVKVRKRPPN